jgi:hypothetical protein
MPKAVTNIVSVSPYHNHSAGDLAEDCMIEMLVESGDSPAQAREKVRTREPSDTDWRNLLN